MYETINISIPKKAERIFGLFLSFYPKVYRQKFGNEMRLVFYEMYQEEILTNGKIRFGFWIWQFSDLSNNALKEHVDLIEKKGIKKYMQQTFNINKYNIFGVILLLPAFIVFCIDLGSRIIQGDLVHYNRPVYKLLSHTPLYWTPVLFVWVIIFPLLAVGINLIPIITKAVKDRDHLKSKTFIKQNFTTLLILTFGLFFVLLVKYHDFAPCMVHGILKVGFGQLDHIVEVCRKA